jgi:hypothetical protein
LRGKNHVVGWKMTPEETQSFFKEQGKSVITFIGFSVDYENEATMLQVVQKVPASYPPETTLVNIGATRGGIGAAYPLAKSLGYTTTGIVSTQVLEYLDEISESVDYVCFIADAQWGGRLSDSEELSPTSEAMVACSDILIGIGGGKIGRDELLAGKGQGKPVYFYPAQVEHAWAIRRAERMGLPPPDSFWGEAHDEFKKHKDIHKI